MNPPLEAELQFSIETAENVSHRVLIYVQVRVTDEAWGGGAVHGVRLDFR